MSVILSFKNLQIKYGSKVVHDFINFEVYKNEFFSIIGPSGVGKTSLISTLIDVDYNIPKGMVFWKNEQFEIQNIASRIGFARQFGSFFTDKTVGENLAFPIENVLGIEHKTAMELAMLNMRLFDLNEEVFYQYPHTLSGGTLKKCMICFATIIKQELIVLDEPISGLDPIAAEKIIELLVSLKKKHTVICVTHHYIPSNRYLLLLKDSYLVGTLKELANNPVSREFILKFMNLNYLDLEV